MSSKAVKTAINDYLAANWTDTVILDVENVHVQQPADAAWVGLQWPGSVEYAAAIGGTCYREEGTFIINLVGVSGQGTDELDTFGETMMGLFRGQNIDGVVIDMVTTPSYREDEDRQENESGNAYVYLISVDYHYDIYA